MKKIIRISLVVILMIIAVCGVYVSDYYHANLQGYDGDFNSIETYVLEDNTLVYQPEQPIAGFIFYPGGKVEYTSYEPLMKELANQGVLCVLVEMPFNLAVLDMNKADGLQAQFPDIDTWYIGGHSLGGSMAASYLEKNISDYQGLILLASYSTADLSSTSLDVLSIYGSEDEVLNKEKYQKYLVNLPSDYQEITIEGGCHAYFGMYGLQKGDGTPTISNIKQIQETASEIINFIVKE